MATFALNPFLQLFQCPFRQLGSTAAATTLSLSLHFLHPYLAAQCILVGWGNRNGHISTSFSSQLPCRPMIIIRKGWLNHKVSCPSWAIAGHPSAVLTHLDQANLITANYRDTHTHFLRVIPGPHNTCQTHLETVGQMVNIHIVLLHTKSMVWT